MTADLEIAEIPFADGRGIQYRYARHKSPDGRRWIRHGLFRAYYPNGNLASEGSYFEGREHGQWRDFHENGQLAAEGTYENGVEAGVWRYWNADGSPSNV